ncbi:MAG: hypothetical protein ACLSAF_00280 [Intestinimonas sp.]
MMMTIHVMVMGYALILFKFRACQHPVALHAAGLVPAAFFWIWRSRRSATHPSPARGAARSSCTQPPVSGLGTAFRQYQHSDTAAGRPAYVRALRGRLRFFPAISRPLPFAVSLCYALPRGSDDDVRLENKIGAQVDGIGARTDGLGPHVEGAAPYLDGVGASSASDHWSSAIPRIDL